MPSARRVRKGQTGKAPNAQIRGGGAGAQGGGGPDKYDGRSNLAAGSPKAQPPTRDDKAATVKTY